MTFIEKKTIESRVIGIILITSIILAILFAMNKTLNYTNNSVKEIGYFKKYLELHWHDLTSPSQSLTFKSFVYYLFITQRGRNKNSTVLPKA